MTGSFLGTAKVGLGSHCGGAGTSTGACQPWADAELGGRGTARVRRSPHCEVETEKPLQARASLTQPLHASFPSHPHLSRDNPLHPDSRCLARRTASSRRRAVRAQRGRPSRRTRLSAPRGARSLLPGPCLDRARRQWTWRPA